MGFFSWNCTECGHSIMAPYVDTGDLNLNKCVVLTPGGNMIKGSYDGYGRVEGFEIDWQKPVQLMHEHCWEEAEKPMEFKRASPNAEGQGFFYDDGEEE